MVDEIVLATDYAYMERTDDPLVHLIELSREVRPSEGIFPTEPRGHISLLDRLRYAMREGRYRLRHAWEALLGREEDTW